MMLVTSKQTHRWVVPKGGIKSGRKSYQSAADEAFEEAGIGGRISRECIGVYGYQKSNQKRSGHFTVKVFPMKVTTQYPDWPERKERRREWVSFDVAVTRVREKDLKKIIESFYRSLNHMRHAPKAGGCKK